MADDYDAPIGPEPYKRPSYSTYDKPAEPGGAAPTSRLGRLRERIRVSRIGRTRTSQDIGRGLGERKKRIITRGRTWVSAQAGSREAQKSLYEMRAEDRRLREQARMYPGTITRGARAVRRFAETPRVRRYGPPPKQSLFMMAGVRPMGLGTRRPSVSMPSQAGGFFPGLGGGRYETQRIGIPRGTIKSYWSKKVKSLAKSMVRAHGPEEGIARTRSVAGELGWKMQ